ncbi:MAG TPA: magnesium transporter, partial [Polyangiaceae bacterium]|nr:magnesium transporter [Polyangiaceae bacterium]
MRLGPLLAPDIKEILKEDPEQVRLALEELELHPEDLADIVAELSPEEASILMTKLTAAEAAPIFERLDENEQQELAGAMPTESVARIASEMEPDDRADLFSLLPPALGDQVFETLEKVDAEAAEEVREIEKFPETAAGHLMTTKYVQILPHSLVSDALFAVKAFVREHPDSPVYNVYVMSGQDKLIGLLSLREMVAAEANESVDDVARTNIITVPPLMDQEEVARYMAKYDLAVIPVVDEKGIMHGVITIDDIVDVLTQEGTEDVQKIGAVEPLDVPYFQTSFTTFVKKRAGWLIILFFEEFFTQTALRHYEPIMMAVTSALLYVPLLISAGGNSGSQSSTLIIRGLAVGEIKMKDWWRILLRELAMGVTLGLMIALIAIGRVLMYPDQTYLFALTVGITVFFIIIAGCTVGSMLPLILKKLGVDPATSST